MLCLCSTMGAAAVRGSSTPEWFAENGETRRKGEELSETFLSSPVALRPGEVLLLHRRGRGEASLPMPRRTAPYAVVGIRASVVDERNASVPADEVYVHHWLAWVVGATPEEKVVDCPADTEYDFSLSAAGHTSVTGSRLPEGYGLLVNHHSQWRLNAHVMRTDSVKSPKDCIECRWTEDKGCAEEQDATLWCCSEYARCSALGDEPKTYRLRWTVHFVEEGAVQPASTVTLSTPKCRRVYDVPRNDEHPFHVASAAYVAQASIRIVGLFGHSHNGGRNVSLFLNDNFVCASTAAYGSTPRLPGDERGYLVRMSDCVLHRRQDTRRHDTQRHLLVKKGDVLRVDSWYYAGIDDPYTVGGGHSVAMGLIKAWYLPVD